MQRPSIRHSQNRNLKIHPEEYFLGLKVMWNKGPFISEYLHILHRTMMGALARYREVFAFRLDLRYPDGYIPSDNNYQNEVIERFISSFKAKIKYNRQRATLEHEYAHDSDVRYVWARENGQRGGTHYHLVIFLNKDAFSSLGKFEPGRDNIYNRLNEAWASALRLPVEAITGRVQFPENPCYYLNRYNQEGLDALFYRASYLCKSATKVYGNGAHGFGASRTY